MAFWETFCAWLLFYFVIQHISYKQWRNKAFKAFVMLSERYSTNACYIRSNHCGLNHTYFHGGMLFSDSLHFLKLFLFNIIFWTQSMNMSVLFLFFCWANSDHAVLQYYLCWHAESYKWLVYCVEFYIMGNHIAKGCMLPVWEADLTSLPDIKISVVLRNALMEFLSHFVLGNL